MCSYCHFALGVGVYESVSFATGIFCLFIFGPVQKMKRCRYTTVVSEHVDRRLWAGCFLCCGRRTFCVSRCLAGFKFKAYLVGSVDVVVILYVSVVLELVMGDSLQTAPRMGGTFF